MADIEPPSFSLGLDFDSESVPPNPDPHPDPDPITHESKSTFADPEVEDEELGFQFRVSDSDPDEPGPVLRRLRRGGPSSSKHISNPIQKSETLPTSIVADDDIEEFSSQEYGPTDDLPAPRHNTLCSSSKVPLSGCGILLSQHATELRDKKRKQDSSFHPTTTSVDASRGTSMLSDLSASPLRRFQLLDSDSDLDVPSESVHNKRDASVVGSSKQEKRKGSIQDYFQVTCEKKTKLSTPVSQKQDLWNDFYEDKSRSVPTPAFDEFCAEYFNSVKQKKGVPGSATEHRSSAQGNNVNFTNKTKQHTDLGFAGPPSHQYFFHDDLRIQNLVRSRLPYFCPLGAPGDTRSKPSNASAIDYMCQFGHGDAAKQQTGIKSNAGKSSRRSGKKGNTSNVESTSHASGDWINPKQAVNIPKDAGRRRVHADGQSAGHWFTAENGKKVYVTRNGKELTGRQAYTHYRKESGKGYKRTKKKKATKKK